MQSKAATVEQYLAELPDDRRAAVAAVRNVILKNLDKDIEEVMSDGMIGYGVRHSVYPSGYHCDPNVPLPYAGLASQKGHLSLYMCSLYNGCAGGKESPTLKWFREAWAKRGKKLDMGKSCVRFKRLEDVPLDVIGEAIRRVPAKKAIKEYEDARAEYEALKAAGKGGSQKKAGTKNASAKKPTKNKATKNKAGR